MSRRPKRPVDHQWAARPTYRDLRLAQAADEVRAEVFGELAFSHSLLCQLSLPYKNLNSQRVFERRSGKVSIRLEAGSLMTPTGRWKDMGLPYGSKSRLLMLFLCSQSIKQQSPTIEVSDSFTQFCRDIGSKRPNGRAMRAIKEQIDRLACVSMKLASTEGHGQFQGFVFDGIRVASTIDDRQGYMFDNMFSFNPTFYESLKEHSVPLDLRCLRGLQHSSRALDIYVWLTERLRRIRQGRSQMVRWTSLRFQFGDPNQDLDSFKRAFKTALKQTLILYYQAANSVEVVRGGLRLSYAPPSVPMKNLLSSS